MQNPFDFVGGRRRTSRPGRPVRHRRHFKSTAHPRSRKLRAALSAAARANPICAAGLLLLWRASAEKRCRNWWRSPRASLHRGWRKRPEQQSKREQRQLGRIEGRLRISILRLKAKDEITARWQRQCGRTLSDMAAMRRVRMDIFGYLRLISLRALTLDRQDSQAILSLRVPRLAYKTLSG